MAGNSNSGRRPKPTAIQAALGDKRALARQATELPQVVMKQEPPDWFKPSAVWVWEKHYSSLTAMGVLSETDLLAFIQLCKVYGALIDHQKKYQGRPDYIPVRDSRG